MSLTKRSKGVDIMRKTTWPVEKIFSWYPWYAPGGPWLEGLAFLKNIPDVQERQEERTYACSIGGDARTEQIGHGCAVFNVLTLL